MTIGAGRSPDFFNRQKLVAEMPSVSVLKSFSDMSFINTSVALNVNILNTKRQHVFSFIPYCRVVRYVFGGEMDTAGRINILRLLNGYTQEAIAALLGISRSSIVVWESGRHPPAPEFVIRLAELVGVEPGYISYGSPRLSCCVWIPAPPDRAQNLSPYLRDIASLFPEFLDENGLDAARFSKLGDGGTMFLLGREKEYSCLMLVRKSLSERFIKILHGRGAVEMGSFDRVTIEIFGEDELTFIAKHAADFSVNLDGIWKAFVKARLGGRVKEDALNILFTAFSIVMQQYKISAEDQLKLSNFFTEKYRALPLLHNLSAANLQGEVRKFLESLGCQRRK